MRNAADYRPTFVHETCCTFDDTVMCDVSHSSASEHCDII